MWKEGAVMGKIKYISIAAVVLGIALTIVYIFVAVKHVDLLDNFIPAVVFECSTLLILIMSVMIAMKGGLKLGFSVPLVLITLVFVIFINGLNIAFIDEIEQTYFIIMNAAMLILYFIIFFPIYIMGRLKS